MIDPRYYQLMFGFISLTAPWSVLVSLVLPPRYLFIQYFNLSVMLASLCYWFEPIDGWRRNCDILLVVITAFLNYRIASVVHMQWMIFLLFCHCFFVSLSWILHWNDHALLSVMTWMCLHLVVHGGNTITYLLLSIQYALQS